MLTQKLECEVAAESTPKIGLVSALPYEPPRLLVLNVLEVIAGASGPASDLGQPGGFRT